MHTTFGTRLFFQRKKEIVCQICFFLIIHFVVLTSKNFIRFYTWSRKTNIRNWIPLASQVNLWWIINEIYSSVRVFFNIPSLHNHSLMMFLIHFIVPWQRTIQSNENIYFTADENSKKHQEEKRLVKSARETIFCGQNSKLTVRVWCHPRTLSACVIS